MPRDPLLEERQKTHGDFKTQAAISQALKETVRGTTNFKYLSLQHTEALEMIVHKIARILAGNANFKDHWNDIAGYARLGSEACQETGDVAGLQRKVGGQDPSDHYPPQS